MNERYELSAPPAPERRELIKKALAGGVAFAVPTVVFSGPAAAATSCGCIGAPTFFFAAGSGTHTGGCFSYQNVTRPFCRTTTTKAVVLSSTSTGTGTPDVDELFAVFVTSPTNVVRSRNFIRYQADCKLATSLPDVVASNGFGGPINLTPLFGAECGTFSVRVAVRNGFTPYGWSAVWVV